MARNDDTGILLSEKLPVPKGRASEPRVGRGSAAGKRSKLPLVIGVLALAAGGAGGFVLRPMIAPDPRIAAAQVEVADAHKTMTLQQDRADALDKQLTTVTAARTAAEKELAAAKQAQSELASKIAEAEAKAKDVAAVQAKIKASVDKSTGSVASEGEEIHVQLPDRVLFKPGDDQLTEQGKRAIAKLSAALKDLPDRQVWVQGHTDDQPVFNPPAPKKPAKGAPPVVPVAPRFATNWELSAARALAVVHYMQDTARLEPVRLAALAFSQYRPVSRSNKAANRRIEIVLLPKKSAPAK